MSRLRFGTSMYTLVDYDVSNMFALSLYDVAAKSIKFKVSTDDSDVDSDQEDSTPAPVSVHFINSPASKSYPPTDVPPNTNGYIIKPSTSRASYTFLQ